MSNLSYFLIFSVLLLHLCEINHTGLQNLCRSCPCENTVIAVPLLDMNSHQAEVAHHSLFYFVINIKVSAEH